MRGFRPGRFETVHRVVDPTLRTLTSLATGVFFTHPVTHNKVRVVGLGFVADSDTGVVTTVPVIELQKLRAADNGTPVALYSGSRVNAVVASQQGPVAAHKSLDQAVVGDDGLLGVENFVTLVRGDLIKLNLITQGGGGTQTGYAYYEFQEEDDADTSTPIG